MLRTRDFLISFTAGHIKLTSDSVVHIGVFFSMRTRSQRPNRAGVTMKYNEIQWNTINQTILRGCGEKQGRYFPLVILIMA